MSEVTENTKVCCVFGITKQSQAELIDPKWCKEHCQVENAIDKSRRSYECFWHFNKYGLDMSKQ